GGTPGVWAKPEKNGVPRGASFGAGADCAHAAVTAATMQRRVQSVFMMPQLSDVEKSSQVTGPIKGFTANSAKILHLFEKLLANGFDVCCNEPTRGSSLPNGKPFFQGGQTCPELQPLPRRRRRASRCRSRMTRSRCGPTKSG